MEMYTVHHDALMVPVQVTSKDFVMGGERVQAVSVSASKDKSGKMHISLTNIDNKNGQEIEIDLQGFKAKSVTGRILTSSKIQDHNTFDKPEKVIPKTFTSATLSKGILKVTMPPHAVVVLELTAL
jgi:alpha-N-arabinofuranosidase